MSFRCLVDVLLCAKSLGGLEMTINQIRYFIVTAKCLNFTKAADQLYISQSALSRQIISMEAELNLQLFQRTQRYVKLTPAGAKLLEGFESILDAYSNAVAAAKSVQYGITGSLAIGILDGTRIDDLFPPVIQLFARRYPQMDISLRNYSFNGLVEGLYDGSLDLAITLLFDIKDRNNLEYRVIEKTEDHIVVPITHPLAARNRASLFDCKEDTFIIVAHEDSGVSGKLIIDACKRQGFMPNIRHSPSIQTSMLWLQAGMGVAILDTRNQLLDNPNVHFLHTEQVSDPSLVLAWSQDNQNPYRAHFAKEFFAVIRKSNAHL